MELVAYLMLLLFQLRFCSKIARKQKSTKSKQIQQPFTDENYSSYSYRWVPTGKDFAYTRALFNLFRNVMNYRNLPKIV